ncbi:hypothetical protein A3C09_01445 [Candidatus Uhrbacteria bacterium RIFCSPHIGHO2_02_FULL_47_44]|nr:MAG: hypothetical protein A2839_02325 [Candidatus Uhrbacteria bacterium RIFCSPHIGHO2_01_FULL_47_10]OGL69830.1 MAG: hypothetical protein A3C09_01445 [Candidatus Uhrbacteria bacterium RIFCSPHIGHO2_02_FULL_47_44]OGL77450.1 MAG: hypothetical protein A3E97_00505 [Candidatus Uhrbacteria bacterium RIFCSPHIGHO2_12_FULL_47_12]
MRFEYRIVTRTASRHRRSEDACEAMIDSLNRFVAVVADGHGPDLQTDRAQELSKQVASELVREVVERQDLGVFPEICGAVQTRVKVTFKKIPVGAVATCVVADERGITIAQVGDCVVLKFIPDESFRVERLTQDHVPDNPTEIPRLRPYYADGKFDSHIYEHGNFCVSRLHCKKTGATAAFTRSFGDPDFRPIVTHEPEVKFFEHVSEDELYAVCSDGGEDTARIAFRRLKNKRVPHDDQFMDTLERFATEELPDRPDDDITIIFFRVLRDSPTS